MEHCNQKVQNMSNNESNEKIEVDLAELLPKIADNGLPVTNRPMWAKLWDAKAARYNALAEQMEKAGVDLQLLIDYRSAQEELTQLEVEHAHDTGFIHGALGMVAAAEEEGVVNA